MQQIKLNCSSKEKIENNLGAYFHGWLMNQLEGSLVEELHSMETNPFAIYVEQVHDKVQFVLSLLNEKAIEIFSPILLSSSLTTINLEASRQKEFQIKNREIENLSEKDLADVFYRENSQKNFDISFVTPAGFKSKGEYIFFPDLRLFYQSLMKKYNYAFTGSESVDVDMLEKLCENTQIVSYRIMSSYYKIHRSFVPGFKGTIRIRCRGNQTINSFLTSLIKFGEYSGVGIKTGMGMGALQLKENRK
ncbi:CRISPR-associated endoribonuclease Cas6 [Tetragenococcus koreensis]|uniref:Cas6 family CRISPR repeat RNA endoribonuclease n=2 Tax=Tetragenococcus muriaticus TaxID=64642 RepID=A0A091C938_9ENTE|nr:MULTISPECIES: CRISPR-associated endoribonuclease Cas6 [Tetragenococcus]KFN93305.1 Cas6 family CRISPR repeat RNA endoribonuclease [Tetragenococcus muriaticus PMC-11-5]MCF1613624.1 CRISPR-associated endoribonuclease Cas6 [Tetragenococcus koreensis]MCF1623380.1 CRISPR-associated endoribonuclease Cas6 [Tetragenococcus koreensis]